MAGREATGNALNHDLEAARVRRIIVAKDTDIQTSRRSGAFLRPTDRLQGAHDGRYRDAQSWNARSV